MQIKCKDSIGRLISERNISTIRCNSALKIKKYVQLCSAVIQSRPFAEATLLPNSRRAAVQSSLSIITSISVTPLCASALLIATASSSAVFTLMPRPSPSPALNTSMRAAYAQFLMSLYGPSWILTSIVYPLQQELKTI